MVSERSEELAAENVDSQISLAGRENFPRQREFPTWIWTIGT